MSRLGHSAFDPRPHRLVGLRKDHGGFPGAPGRVKKLLGRLLRLALPALALTAGPWLVAPAELLAFVKSGELLDTTQRDVRVFNNFADSRSNDNVAPDSQFPGALGAELAIWKAASEWASRPHGSGQGDPTQPNLGDGGANFDYAWGGNASGVGSTNDNVISAISGCAGGLVTFTETPSADGWRGRFCDDAWVFNDGPGQIAPMQYDIQSGATHILGIALGLGNSGIEPNTMSGIIRQGLTELRSIEPDDIAGIQCIYGVAAPTKPEITDVLHGVGMLTLEGRNFAATGNEVWFTNSMTTNPAVDPIVRVAGVPSTAGGTRIDVAIPVGAGPGEVLVKLPGGTTGDLLSNGFPTPLDPFFPNRSLPSERGALDPVLTDTGGDPLFGPRIGDATEHFNLSLDCSGSSSPGVYTMVLRLGHTPSPATTGLGFLYCIGPKVFKCPGAHAQNVVECVPGGVVLPNDVAFVDLTYCQQGFCSSPGRLSNAIVTTIGR